MKRFLTIIFIVFTAFVFNACSNNFLETSSTTNVDQIQIFKTTDAAMTAVNGLHRRMYMAGSYAPRFSYGTYMLWNDFMGEDLVYTKGNAQWRPQTQWETHRSPTSGHLTHVYEFFYKLIANANMIIANIDNASGTQSERDYIKGQALAYRGFAHFCLVQWFGERYYAGKSNTQEGVILSLDNSLTQRARSSVEDVYTQVNKDLDDAITLLGGTKEKRAAKCDIDINVARAIKARVLLTQGKWIEAAEMAKTVVDKSGASLKSDTYKFAQGRMCDASNSEWIWAKIGAPTVETGTLVNFYSYISNTNVSYNRNTPRAIYNLLYNKISSTDVRKSVWLPDAPTMSKTSIAYPKSGNIFKWMSQKYIVDYPDNTSASYLGNLYTADLAYIRLPEMILIVAEGYARGGNFIEAAKALYPLAHSRDANYVLSANTGDALIDEIMVQRRVELWGEGFRFLDLKRLNMDLDRGPAPRAGYNQGGASNNWKNGKNPTNLDPLASNFNMYDDQVIGEECRFIPANSIKWQFAIPQSEIDSNPLCTQNPL